MDAFRSLRWALRSIFVAWTVLVCFRSKSFSTLASGDPLVQNFGAIHECEPQSSGAQTVKTRILGPTEETLRLRCGSDDRAVLTPAKGNRFFPDKDHTLAGESLNNVCDGATLVPSEGSTQPKTYTLNVGRRGRKPRDLYYKCTLATVSPWAVTAGEGHGAGAQQNTTMKTCILEIKVEAEEPQGPEPKPAKGYHAKPKARGGSSMQEASNPDVIKRCDLDDTTTPEIDLTLPLDAPSVSFSCGKKGSAALKPKASEAKFCADAACGETESLSAFSEGAHMDEQSVNGENIYTLSIGSRPSTDRQIFFSCSTAGTQDVPSKVTKSSPGSEDKNCIVKLTVMGQERHPTSMAWQPMAPSHVVAVVVASAVFQSLLW